MTRLRPLLLIVAVAGAGAMATLIAARAVGMAGAEVLHLATFVLPAAAATVVAAAVAPRLLTGVPLRLRLLSVALVAVGVSLANLGVLAGLMFVRHEAADVAILLLYSTGAGVASSLVVARSFSHAIDRLMQAAERLARGNLGTRVGDVEGGAELQRLAITIDEMASRLEASTAREEQAVRVRNDVVTAVSHDLRTPLSALRAMVEALDEGVVDDPETVRRYMRQMRGAVETLVLLVDDLFELVQLDVGALEAETHRARLGDLIHAALRACEGGALAKGLSLEADVDEVETSLCSPRLSRLVQNLVQNAIRHTPADGTVRVTASRAGGAISVVMEDTGEGIPPESLERVFEPFWRGDAARSSDGSGLGLALAKRIVEALGGRIGVESHVALGSRFAIVLPEATPGPQQS